MGGEHGLGDSPVAGLRGQGEGPAEEGERQIDRGRRGLDSNQVDVFKDDAAGRGDAIVQRMLMDQQGADSD